MREYFLVFCLDDIDESGRACHVLATHRFFESFEEAEAYAKTIASTRNPIIIRW